MLREQNGLARSIRSSTLLSENYDSTISGFTPFELQFGKETPHILATLKTYWLDSENIPINVTDFMLNLQ